MFGVGVGGSCSIGDVLELLKHLDDAVRLEVVAGGLLLQHLHGRSKHGRSKSLT